MPDRPDALTTGSANFADDPESRTAGPQHSRDALTTGSSLKSFPLAGYVFIAVFVLRLIVLVRLAESPFLLPAQGDMHFYNEWALRVLRGEFTDYRAFYGLPLYPYLLAGLYKIFGFSPFIPGMVQAGLEAGTATLILRIGSRVFSPDGRAGKNLRGIVIGILAALGWAFYLPAQSYSVIIMPTSWLLFAFWWLVWQIIKRDSAPSFWLLFVFGAVIGFAAMGIATILFLLPLLIAAIFVKWERPAHFRLESFRGRRPAFDWRRDRNLAGLAA